MNLRRFVLWRELVLVLVVGLIQIGGTAAAAQDQDEYGNSLPPGGVLLLAVAVAAVPLRVRHPVAAAWTAKLATLLYWSLALPRGPIFFAMIITFGNLLIAGHRRHAIAVAATGFVGFQWLGAILDRHDAPTLLSFAALATWLITLFSVSEAIRARRDRAREAARSREATVQRQVANERLQMARELHDVVAHNMSLINLQAGVALHVADDASPVVRESLETIKAASKEALVELRSILGVLRHVDDVDDSVSPGETARSNDRDEPSSDVVRSSAVPRVAAEGGSSVAPETNGRAPRRPTPGLDGLDQLVSRSRAAGVDVTSHVDVDVNDVPQPVQLAAYRIVQESLTNVARHANPPTATLTIRTNGDTLHIDVVDEGTGAPTDHALPSGGNGLPGMRERAASVGGDVTASHRIGGGFAVNARLPLGDAP